MRPEKTEHQPAEPLKLPEAQPPSRCVLQLFIAGITAQSARAILNLRKICERLNSAQCDIEVIDIYQNPARAAEEQIIAVPALIKKEPKPVHKFIGDLCDHEKILKALKFSSNGVGPR